VKQSGTGFDSQSIEALTYEDVSNYSFISKRLEAVGASLDHNIYISNSQRPDWGVIKINLNSRAVDRKMQVDVNEAYHHFKLTDLAYKAYFSQRFTFNEIVASSRFKLVRDPNDYNLEVLKVVNNIL